MQLLYDLVQEWAFIHASPFAYRVKFVKPSLIDCLDPGITRFSAPNTSPNVAKSIPRKKKFQKRLIFLLPGNLFSSFYYSDCFVVAF